MSTKNVLFVSHQASHTGAPLLLINVAKLITEQMADYNITFMIKEPPYGLKDQLKQFHTTYASYEANSFRWVLYKIGSKVPSLSFLKKFRFAEKRIIKALKGIDIVVLNTLSNGELVDIIKAHFKGPVFSYIHELRTSSLNVNSKAQMVASLGNTDRFFVPSYAVKQFLMTDFGIKDELVDIFPSYIPAGGISTIKKEERKEQNKFIVGAAGTTDWRKGADIFIQVAARLFKKRPDANIEFQWMGASATYGGLKELLHDVERADLTDKVFFKMASEDMPAYYRGLNVFLLTSREDPYPLVVLEAADAGLPAICFERGGGMPEFIHRSGGGTCVPYLDTDAMADAILFYYDNEAIRAQHGLLANAELKKTHQDKKGIAQIFKQILEKA